MKELLAEIALRFIKPAAAGLIGLLIYLAATGLFGATPSVELGLLAWLSGAAAILLVESGPI